MISLKENIEGLLAQRNWDGLSLLMQRLSNSEFRRVERMVRDEILAEMDNEAFWSSYRFFVLYRPQAFLPCISDIKHLAADGSLDFKNGDVEEIAKGVSKENIRKLVGMAIPQLENESQIDALFNAFNFHSGQGCASVLIRHHTPLCYYMLFKTLVSHHDDRGLILKCCRYLLKQNDDMSYNMASILRSYFGLHEIKSQLSLKIEPYELNYMDKNADTFYYILGGRRPKV